MNTKNNEPKDTLNNIYKELSYLNPALRRIGDYIINNPEKCKTITIKELATACEVAESTVTRFVRETGFDSYQQLKSESKLAHKPPTLSFEQAAVVPISGMTALQALTDAGRIQPGQKVLVIGASGGVGSYAVQLAKAFGAEVTGVCSTAKLDLVRSLGADHVVDYTCDDFAEGGERYDLILDIAGGSRLSRLRRALTSSGTAVLVGNEKGDSLTGGMGRQLRARVVSLFVRQRLTSLLSKERGSDVERLAELLASGQLTPSIDQTFPLERAPEAMSLLEGGRVRGKVAISVTGVSADQEG